VYECAYLALALHLEAPYVSADRRFWQKANARDDLRAGIIMLSDLR